MPDLLTLPNILGFAAGGLVAASSLPQILANIQQPSLASRQSVERNVLVLAGNLIWIGWGFVTGSLPVICFCCVTAILTIVLLIQQRRLRNRPH